MNVLSAGTLCYNKVGGRASFMLRTANDSESRFVFCPCEQNTLDVLYDYLNILLMP